MNQMQKPVYVDALQCSNFDRETLEELREGKLNLVTCTVSYWENAAETMREISKWNDLEREHSDLFTLVKDRASFEQTLAADGLGIVLGSQNSSPIEDRIRNIELFREMGLAVMQLTYNIQNAIGGSCYEPNDSGLTRFGREVLDEMTAVGMLADLSHVGNRTSYDAILASSSPVAITHANPDALIPHPRNKSADVLRALADNGGVLGLATYSNIGGDWVSSPQRWAEMVERTVDMIGVEHVGIGTDLGQKVTESDVSWMRHGHWSRQLQFGAAPTGSEESKPDPEWCRSAAQFPEFDSALRDRGFSDVDRERVLGGNWSRLYAETCFR